MCSTPPTPRAGTVISLPNPSSAVPVGDVDDGALPFGIDDVTREVDGAAVDDRPQRRRSSPEPRHVHAGGQRLGRSRRRVASIRRRPARRRERAGRATMCRSVEASRSFQPTHDPNTASHTTIPVPFTQADCSSSLWSRFHRRVWCSMWRRSNQCAASTPGAGVSANHCAQLISWSPMRSSGTRDSPSSTGGGIQRLPGPRRGPARLRASCRGTRRRRRARSTSTASSSASLRGSRRVPTSHGL